MASTFNQLRTRDLSLENQLSGKLAKLSEYAQHPGSRASPEETRTQEEIASLIEQIGALCDDLQRIVDSDPSISTSKMQQVARHKENLQQFVLDHERINRAIDDERNRLNLLSTVRSDITQRQQQETVQNSDDYMLDERMRIDQQHSVVDQLLGQVFETRDEILRQRSTLRSMGNKLQRSLSTMPGINVLLGKIGTRRRRDQLIIAAVITVCIILLWFAW